MPGGKTSFSARTIEKAVELFPVAEGSEPDSDYFKKVATFLDGMQGQYNHDFSTQLATAKKNLTLDAETVKNYSEEQKLALLKALQPQGDPSPPDEDRMTALEQKIQDLTDEMKSKADEQARSMLKTKLRDAMRAHGASDEYVLNKALDKAELDSDKTFDALLQANLDLYDAELKLCRGDGALPRHRVAGGSGGGSWLDAKFAEKAAKEGWGGKK